MTSLNWLIGLITLTAMEIVLGIDNIIFIALVVGRLPAARQGTARTLGLGLALLMRLGLLFSITWLLGLTRPVLVLSDFGIPEGWLPAASNALSWRDLILIGGGLFLIAKSTHEIHHTLEGAGESAAGGGSASFGWVVAQIVVIDMVFSLDSVITAVGMAAQLWVMVVAVVLAVGVMLVFARPIGDFVHRHPTLKMLALSFLILIGVLLIADGFEQHLQRGYIYFTMLFALAMELLNQRLRSRQAAGKAPPAAAPAGGD